MTVVTFNEQELQGLLSLIDLAVKAGGLQVAGPAFVLQQKLVTAYQAAQAPAPVEPTAEA